MLCVSPESVGRAPTFVQYIGGASTSVVTSHWLPVRNCLVFSPSPSGHALIRVSWVPLNCTLERSVCM